jgi:ethanolamine-phosphate phospho-lyase
MKTFEIVLYLRFELTFMEQLLSRLFGVKADNITALDGYENKNYLIESANQKWVFKDYPFDQSLLMFLKSESEYIDFLSDKGTYPKMCLSVNKNYCEVEDGRIYRLLTYVEGDLFVSINGDHSYLKSLGVKIAQIHNQSKGYYDPKLLARVDNHWDIQYLESSARYIDDCETARQKKFLKYFYHQYQQKVVPVIPSLRKAVIHGDINEHNILIENGEVKSFFDFGDVVYGPLINDLAVAVTYVGLNYENRIKAIGEVVHAYHQVNPLDTMELDILYNLISARLIQSLANAAHSSKLQPENKEYITVNSKAAWLMIEEWTSVNPIGFRNEMYEACGFDIPEVKDINIELKRREASISKALSVSDLAIESAAFQYMYATDGKTYLDLRNNIPHVGHCHPEVVEANVNQQYRLNTNTRYVYDELSDYAENLLSHFPEKLDKVFFVNSGSAAGDLALRIAQTVTGKDTVVALEQGYHGNTQRMIEVSHYKYGAKGGFDQKSDVLKVPMPWNYAVTHGSNAKDYLMSEAKKDLEGATVGAFIAEPIVGCGGQLELPEGYLSEMYELIRSKGGLCISDEVQTGFARMGKTWWGYELYDVTPDIIVLGKCIGNGHPMAAVVTTTEISENFTNGMEFFSSFGGNPVSCVNGNAVLNVLKEEQLKENANQVGDYLKQGLQKIAEKHKGVGVVRGSGFFLGVELVEEKDSSKPNTALCYKVKKSMFNDQILVGSDGPADNILKIKPPMCFTMENADTFLKGFEKALV